ncbi:hypothetical protein B0H67DRAFT_566500 [Lasiosphaeris hirsuta]|uniref:Methyltransferase n=1 Tax=Lasiosphaeris hirsuta TaxID=260670 RepID=A0AA40BD95_9PEZI|nr:hypothetical protein B0H67DRAFT_566500 [Lasiosphaeris hirsuta]
MHAYSDSTMGPAPIDEQASIVYLEWQELYESEKPFQVFADVPQGFHGRLTNLVFAPAPPLEIRDLRGREDAYTLDANGFRLVRNRMPAFDLSTKESMESNVVPYLEDLVTKHVDGADFVRCFDWGFRKNVEMTMPKMDVNDKMQMLNPGKQAHCDQSPAGALGRLQYHAPEMVERAERLRIINLWRPLNHPAKDNTLAVCDGSTIVATDLVEADHISSTYLGSTVYGLYSPKHRWHYLRHQTPEEVFLIKIFDSDPDVNAECSLHAAFDYTHVPEDALPRESLEMRFLVVSISEKDRSKDDRD